MLACSRWVAWSVPLRVNSRSAVNWHSMRFIHEQLPGVQAISALLAAAQAPTRLSFLVDRCGLKLPQTIAIRVCGGCRLRRYRQNSRNSPRRLRFLMCGCSTLIWPHPRGLAGGSFDTPGRFRGRRDVWVDCWLHPVVVRLPCGAGMGSRVELFAAIRWDYQREGLGVRPPDRKQPVRAAPVRAAVAGWIDAMLREDLEAPRKQRHTAKRVFERLRDEHDAQVSYSTVAKYVQRRRAEIAAGARAEA